MWAGQSTLPLSADNRVSTSVLSRWRAGPALRGAATDWGGGVQRELVLSLMTPGPALSPIDGKGRGWAASFPPPCHHVADEGGGVLSAALSSQD